MHSFFGQEFDSPHLHQNEKSSLCCSYFFAENGGSYVFCVIINLWNKLFQNLSDGLQRNYNMSSERMMRDENGKSIKTDYMSYDECKKKYVDDKGYN